MNSLVFIPLGICFAMTGCYAAPSATPKVLLAQTHPNKIAQVKAGTLKTANASWWGFDKSDSTEALQSAINSGVPNLIVDNTGSDWIINKTIKLASNQKIIFADGVVIQAKVDCFHGVGDSLFQGEGLINLTMQGEGTAILRMRKKDYQDATRYTPAEWRMGIALYGCQNVIIRNLTITQTGGDGLYLGADEEGFNKNILVEDVNFDENHRLGMAVISAQDLTIRNCKFINTSGTAPNGGLDFEPNYPGQRLVNITVKDSLFANNHTPGGFSDNGGMGVSISPAQLTESSIPISIKISGSHFENNDKAVTMWPVKSPSQKSVKGEVVFENCHFDNDTVYLINPVAGGISYVFKDCQMNFGAPASVSSAATPIMFVTDFRVKSPTLGGVTFENVTVQTHKNQLPLKLDFWEAVKISDQIKGTLHVIEGQNEYEIKLPNYIVKNRKQLEVPWQYRLRKLKAQLLRNNEAYYSEAELLKNKTRIDALEKAGALTTNLLLNANFSVLQSDRKLPLNWTTWQAGNSKGSFGFDSKISHTSDASGAITLSGISNGVYLQEIPVKPGESFVVEAWMRRIGQGVGSLGIAWKTADNKWIDNSKGPSFYIPNKMDDEHVWQKAEGIVTAPKDAAIMSVQCRVQYQRTDQDKIWFDDLGVYKAPNIHQ